MGSFLIAFEPVIVVLHFIVAFFLIGVILLQAGKGTDIGAAFGAGGSQSLFGSAGGGNFLTKLTTAAAIIFLATSLSLATISNKSSTITETSIISKQLEALTPNEKASDENQVDEDLLVDDDAPAEAPVEDGN